MIFTRLYLQDYVRQLKTTFVSSTSKAVGNSVTIMPTASGKSYD
jgi:hypothetical protein